ncbi:MAG TPA: HD domain-containing protein [Sphingobacteriaceae bacterium]|nr:HD domain-containing protein [Sphingobacteriaceae bacterium]
MDRLDRQLNFILAIDQLKNIRRQNLLLDGSRRENSAEHSWHLATAAMILAEYAREPVDMAKVLSMLLIHDVVEIDAGDTFVYDEKAAETKAEREEEAARRLFGLLPPDQARWCRDLWEEFEARQTPEARFAAAVDRLMPILLNARNGGYPWRRHGITARQVLARNRTMAEGAPVLWERVQEIVADALNRGLLYDDDFNSSGDSAP